MAAAARTVYVVDDDEAVLDSMAMLLRAAGFKPRPFASPLEFLADYRPQGPECLVLDVRMPRLNGLEVQRRLIARGAHIPVIFVSGHADIPMAVEAMRRGALDFLVKPVADAELLRRLKEAFAAVPGRRLRVSQGERLRGLALLSEREREVLGGILDGKTNHVLARELAISPKTVEYHRARIMRTLGVRSAAELFQFCLDTAGSTTNSLT